MPTTVTGTPFLGMIVQTVDLAILGIATTIIVDLMTRLRPSAATTII